MEKLNAAYFFRRLVNKKSHFPWSGQLELTYRCNLNCIHCYCKGLGVTRSTLHVARYTSHVASHPHQVKELSAQEWKRILDELQKEGCLGLTLTGGDPLIRRDFLDIYAYAKEKGFIITIFTNGVTLTDRIIDYLAKSPPFSIEITLNGITKGVYESITGVKGSYDKVIQNIRRLKVKRLPLILKSNCLKQNQRQIGKIKAFTEELLGKPSARKYRFKYGPMIFPRLNQDRTPANSRLSFQELLTVKKQDPDLWDEYERGIKCKFPRLKRDRSYLYLCNAWMRGFFINPFGRLKFCNMSDKFSVDLKTASFKEGFYKAFPQVLNEKFKTDSKCKDCRLRPICYHCPARAYLETGNEEGPVPYYCELAQETARQMQKVKHQTA